MNTCPCCSQPLLRHARHGQIYWFCMHCHQEMPNLEAAIASPRNQRVAFIKLNTVSPRVEALL